LKSFDVIVIGAGPAGSSTAYFLARSGLNVLLLDKFNFPRDKTCGDGLPPRAIGMLEEMGILDEVLALAYTTQRLQVIAPDGYAVNAVISPESNLPGYTAVVPRLILDDLIRRQAVTAGAEFISPFNVQHIESDAHQVTVIGEEERLKAQMVVVAVGANMALLKRLGLLRQTPQPLLAARAYYDDVTLTEDAAQFRFDGLPLPSYGWLFPLPDGRANVGAGFLPNANNSHSMPATSREAFDRFTNSIRMQSILKNARLSSAVKGYPIRTDFATAPTFGERVLLVGEAAGLVNPLTGDGIDYALESGKLAAGDFSRKQFLNYDAALRGQFQPLFMLSNRLRSFLTVPAIFNRVARTAESDKILQKFILALVLRQQQPDLWTLLRVLPRVLRF
jgi:menaquinone-9 beta-reductase